MGDAEQSLNRRAVREKGAFKTKADYKERIYRQTCCRSFLASLLLLYFHFGITDSLGSQGHTYLQSSEIYISIVSHFDRLVFIAF
jgi:hypothetical protein